MLNSRTYLYQRNGVFYIRLRMKTASRLTASLPSHNRYKLASVSLRTRDRRTAMAHSRHIKAALKAIHADSHTMSTILHEQGFNSAWIEIQLAHVDKNSNRGTYNHAQYLEGRREMMQWYGNLI